MVVVLINKLHKPKLTYLGGSQFGGHPIVHYPPPPAPRLIKAIGTANEKKVMDCIKQGDNININYLGKSALEYALFFCQPSSIALSIVKLFLQYGVNTNHKTVRNILNFLKEQNQADTNVLTCLDYLCCQYPDYLPAIQYKDKVNKIVRVTGEKAIKAIEAVTPITTDVIKYIVIEYDDTSLSDRIGFFSYAGIDSELRKIKEEKIAKKPLPFFSSKDSCKERERIQKVDEVQRLDFCSIL